MMQILFINCVTGKKDMLDWTPAPYHPIQEVRRIVSFVMDLPVEDIVVCVQKNENGAGSILVPLTVGTLSENGLNEDSVVNVFYKLFTTPPIYPPPQSPPIDPVLLEMDRQRTLVALPPTPQNLPTPMQVDSQESGTPATQNRAGRQGAEAPLPWDFQIPSTFPPLASDSESDNAPNVVPGSRVSRVAPEQSADRTTDYDDEELLIIESLGGRACPECIKWPRRLCKHCGCRVCGGKNDEHRTAVCDTCGDYYHYDCLVPPLAGLPDGEWHCPKCTKVPSKGKKRATKQKICTTVDAHHFGPIPGVEVGQSFRYRLGASEAGVHRPSMAGISGTPKTGSQSIVLSGGYKDDVDEGDSFVYSGAGGRVNKKTGARVAEVQSFDQTLDKTNAALAITMFPELTDPSKLDNAGAESSDWTKSKPVRVIRSDKMRHSKYAPKEGFRYDGIYKLVRYWPEKGKDGFVTYKYQFRRDDPAPAPWTEEGEARVEELGLKMVCPEGKQGDDEGEEEEEEKKPPPKKRKQVNKNSKTFEPDPRLRELIGLDVASRPVWLNVLSHSADLIEFIEEVLGQFTCLFCFGYPGDPVTFECGHSVCQKCLKPAFSTFGIKCPTCWTTLDGLEEGWDHLGVNLELKAILLYLDHTYDGAPREY
ncbi:PUA-like domain-containing protein [Terfezia claveryi]|nr:PUA-like domain-containing protein [Terfezia claveryi]